MKKYLAIPRSTQEIRQTKKLGSVMSVVSAGMSSFGEFSVSYGSSGMPCSLIAELMVLVAR